MYHGYCKNCFAPAVDEARTMGNGHSVNHLTILLLVGDDYETGYVSKLLLIVILNYVAFATFKLGL